MSQPEKKDTQESARSTAVINKKSRGFTDEERAAMKERAKEMKAEARTNKSKAEGESDVLARIAEMPEPERAMAMRLHEIIKASAPVLAPKTWYGLPAWANAEGKAVCFLTPASKFKSRYAVLGFSDNSSLDDGDMWATSFGIAKLGDAEKKKLIALVKKAVG